MGAQIEREIISDLPCVIENKTICLLIEEAIPRELYTVREPYSYLVSRIVPVLALYRFPNAPLRCYTN